MKAWDEFSTIEGAREYAFPLMKPECRITKETVITKPPKVLCVHINRLSNISPNGQVYKNQNFMQFGLNLNLKSFLKPLGDCS